jgi:hypothetical protein
MVLKNVRADAFSAIGCAADVLAMFFFGQTENRHPAMAFDDDEEDYADDDDFDDDDDDFDDDDDDFDDDDDEDEDFDDDEDFEED